MNTTIFTNISNGNKYELVGTLDVNAETVKVRKADGKETNLKVAYVTDPKRYTTEVVDLPEPEQTETSAPAESEKSAEQPKVDRKKVMLDKRASLIAAMTETGIFSALRTYETCSQNMVVVEKLIDGKSKIVAEVRVQKNGYRLALRANALDFAKLPKYATVFKDYGKKYYLPIQVDTDTIDHVVALFKKSTLEIPKRASRKKEEQENAEK